MQFRKNGLQILKNLSSFSNDTAFVRNYTTKSMESLEVIVNLNLARAL